MKPSHSRWSVIVVVVLVAAVTTSAPGSAKADPPMPSGKPSCSRELEMAQDYARIHDWKDAESQFRAAAEDSDLPEKCRWQAFKGLQLAQNVRIAAQLEVGQVYEAKHQLRQAEELYKTLLLDATIGDATREVARGRLEAILSTQANKHKLPDLRHSVTEWIKDIAAALAFILSSVLLFAAIWSVWRRRRLVLIEIFTAPTEELTKTIGIQLRYARSVINEPALSPAAQMPPFLLENLRFSDEVDDIEDVEIAGSKIPFAALGRIFGQPRVMVRGGFEGAEPIGLAHCVLETRHGLSDSFLWRAIRVGVPNEQRLDLLNFAYDVMVRAYLAHADF